jgi:hypothetical protein
MTPLIGMESTNQATNSYYFPQLIVHPANSDPFIVTVEKEKIHIGIENKSYNAQNISSITVNFDTREDDEYIGFTYENKATKPAISIFNFPFQAEPVPLTIRLVTQILLLLSIKIAIILLIPLKIRKIFTKSLLKREILSNLATPNIP